MSQTRTLLVGLLAALRVFKLNLRLLQVCLRIGGLGQGRLIGQAQCIPALLPELGKLSCVL